MWSTSESVAESLRDEPVVLLPLGQIVQHGPHLPICSDVLQAEAVCRDVADNLDAKGIPAFSGPALLFGCGAAHEVFPGYVTLNEATLTAVLVDVCESLGRQGCRAVVAVVFAPSGWGPLIAAAGTLRRRGSCPLYAYGGRESVARIGADLLQARDGDDGYVDGHAGELETSMVLAIDSSVVRMERAVHGKSELLARMRLLPFGEGSLPQRMMAMGVWSWAELNPQGVIGDATRATAEKGEILLTRLTGEIARYVEDVVLVRGDDRPAEVLDEARR